MATDWHGEGIDRFDVLESLLVTDNSFSAMYSLDSVAPTICLLMGVPPIRGASAEPIREVLQASDGEVEKVLLYTPDAIGEGMFRDYLDEFDPIIEVAGLEVPIRSMNPSYTPVCYGSMFTGMKPHEHGIEKYEKPVLKCDTMFDALARAGKKVAIVAVKDSSIDTIFRGRSVDYYSEKYDPEAEERALQLLEEGGHDLILVYHQEYDDVMHRTTPRSPEALEAFRRHLGTFTRFGEAFNKAWAGYDRAIAFLPDHGTHIDAESGRGSHGSDSPEDMEVRHFWGLYGGE